MDKSLIDTDEISNFLYIEHSATAEMELIELQNNDLLERTHEKSQSVFEKTHYPNLKHCALVVLSMFG